MKITIQGTDYTPALDAAKALTITRKLNAPSLCALWLSLPAGGGLPAPERNQRLLAQSDAGTYLFTGYIVQTPLPLYVGEAVEGPRIRYAIEAVSDEILLDRILLPAGMAMAGASAGSLLCGLVKASGASAIMTSGVNASAQVGFYATEAGANWSASAALAARMGRSSYRGLNGTLSATSMQSVVHTLNESDGALDPCSLTFSAPEQRALANDITVCGEHEAQAYVTEYFVGDGTTLQFELTETPYFPPSAQTMAIRELFSEASIDDRVWSNASGNQAIRLGAGGLTMDGGNGVDGECVLSWRTSIEMGGTLLMEAEGVTLSPGSTGALCGFFVGGETQGECICGFRASNAQSEVSLQPLVMGAASGASYVLSSSAQYTLRLRVYCAEVVRNRALYYAYGDEGLITTGGDTLFTSGRAQLEIQPFVNGVGGMPVTLYDGVIGALPATCMAVPCSSINLIGSMRSFSLSRLGSAWVQSAPVGGGAYTRRQGSTAQAAECHVERSGKLIFYTGYAPAAGEVVSIRYRATGRAVGRAVNAASQAALAANGLPAQACWIGTVSEPPARCSADCRAAASALAQMAASVSALWSGTYKGTQGSFPVDVWPGDALQLVASSLGLSVQTVVRWVTLTYTASQPDRLEYTAAFANDWASDLAIQTSATVPSDAWLPAAVSPTYAENLNTLTVTSVDEATVTIDTGVTPPTGGGFEIRRRDNAFMPGADPDLVMRSSTETMSFARGAYNDRFYVRMYDGATPPNYSEFSAAIFVNMALSS